MKCALIFPGKWKLSKQNSYCAGRNGRRFKNPAYAAEQTRMLICMQPQLLRQEWRATKKLVKLDIEFYGPKPPCDADNYGLLTDSMQGISQIIGGKRIRALGPVVLDDSQFWPVNVDWVKAIDRKIIVYLEERVEKEHEK